MSKKKEKSSEFCSDETTKLPPMKKSFIEKQLAPGDLSPFPVEGHAATSE